MENLNQLHYKFEDKRIPNLLQFPICESKVFINDEMHQERPRWELIFDDETYLEIPFENHQDFILKIGLDFNSDGGILQDGEVIDHLGQFSPLDYQEEFIDYLVSEGVLVKMKDETLNRVFKSIGPDWIIK